MLVGTYRLCSGGMNIVWPDGRALLDQPVKLVSAFAVIGGALRRYKKKDK